MICSGYSLQATQQDASILLPNFLGTNIWDNVILGLKCEQNYDSFRVLVMGGIKQ